MCIDIVVSCKNRCVFMYTYVGQIFCCSWWSAQKVVHRKCTSELGRTMDSPTAWCSTSLGIVLCPCVFFLDQIYWNRVRMDVGNLNVGWQQLGAMKLRWSLWQSGRRCWAVNTPFWTTRTKHMSKNVWE